MAMQDRLTPAEQLDVLFSFASHVIHQTTLNDLLWYTAEEVVARLSFLDCVIYSYDRKREILVQSSAIGEKTTGSRTIITPLEIPLDRGVTGECARTRKPILLPDAAQHPKYVADNIEPGSEVCVPILAGDTLYGVIDCEHPQKASFGKEHVNLLKSVAALVAAQWAQCELIAALQDAEQRARDANAAKSIFLQNMSHEMRTPLNGVLGGAQLMGKVELDARGKSFLDIITSSARMMLNLVDTVLDITAIEAGASMIRGGEVELEPFFDRVRAMFSAQASTRGLAFSVQLNSPPGARFRTDEGAITKLVINLVGNALKFTDEGSVSVIATHSDGRLRLDVRDTGCGLSPDEQELVFERFARTERSRIEAIDGAGVGLALCRELATQLGGEIGVESEVGAGSEFWFEIPELAEPAASP